jgi:hypothetical protein
MLVRQIVHVCHPGTPLVQFAHKKVDRTQDYLTFVYFVICIPILNYIRTVFLLLRHDRLSCGRKLALLSDLRAVVVKPDRHRNQDQCHAS